VNFLVYQIWDTTSMYNYLTNGWTGPHVMSADPHDRESYDHLMSFFDKWLADHPETDLVRLTTLAYHFAVDSDQDGADKLRDWTGYQDTINIGALLDFEREYGYRLRSEDFVDGGYYNSTSRTPSKQILDWMDFTHRFVARFCRELCDKAHAAGKSTGMFWGDHWIGAEPYRDSFEEMGIDVHIGACEDGVALRRIADAPGKHIRECRLYPYFFPDVFNESGDPIKESKANWLKIRRALLRKPIDRIGYGGYPSLAAKFPAFVAHVKDICDEFRAILSVSEGSESWKQPLKVAVLSAWGKRRAWLPMHGPAQKFMEIRPDAFWVAGSNLLECLSGLPVEVCFVSCDEVAQNGVPEGVHVLVNDGAAETSWSGGRHWINPALTAAVRRFVGEGGGIIGCRGPSAYPHGGHYFQMFDVFGVDKETGQSLQSSRVRCLHPEKHFITDDTFTRFDFGSEESWVYSAARTVSLLHEEANHTMLSANEYFAGRAVYIAGLPYSAENCRLLYRALLWAAKQEAHIGRFLSSNQHCEVAFYPQRKVLAVVNNSECEQITEISMDDGTALPVDLSSGRIAFFHVSK
jgi:1,3-beta-galactosyl-N-acetylhexosamine phosphorylase